MKSLTTICLIICGLHLSAQSPSSKSSECFDLYDQKAYSATVKCAEEAIRLDSMDVNAYLVMAYAYTDLKKYQEAYDAYTLGINRTGYGNFLINGRGNLLSSLQQNEAAIRDLSLAVEYAPHDTIKKIALVNRAAALMMIREFEQAYDDLLAAVKIDSTDAAVYINLGALSDEIGKGDMTLHYYEKVLELDSTFIEIYVNIGFKYQSMGQHDKAVECFNKVLASKPDDAFAYNNRGYSKMMTGDLKGAMDDVNKSIKLYPANSYAYRNRALIYLKMDKKDKACEDIQEALIKGFTSMYGDEVLSLQKQHCTN